MPNCFPEINIPRVVEAYNKGEDSVTLAFPNIFKEVVVYNLQSYANVDDAIAASYKTAFVFTSNTIRHTNLKTGEQFYSCGGKGTNVAIQNYILTDDFFKYGVGNLTFGSPDKPFIVYCKINADSSLLSHQ